MKKIDDNLNTICVIMLQVLFQKENDVVATGTVAVGAVGCRVFRGRGRPSHHRRRPTGQRLARKKRGILVPPKNARRRRTGRRAYDTAAADQYRYLHRSRRMCAASEQRQIIITIIAAAAAAVVRTIAAARAHLVAGRYPSCTVVRRRRTLARAYTAAAAIQTRAKGSARPANALQSLDFAQLFRVSSESELLSEHSSSRASPLPPPRTY